MHAVCHVHHACIDLLDNHALVNEFTAACGRRIYRQQLFGNFQLCSFIICGIVQGDSRLAALCIEFQQETFYI
jgi:hypothetical protein